MPIGQSDHGVLVGPRVDDGLFDAFRHYWLRSMPVPDAVNYARLANAATGGLPTLTFDGSDASVSGRLAATGGGRIELQHTQAGLSETLRLENLTAIGAGVGTQLKHRTGGLDLAAVIAGSLDGSGNAYLASSVGAAGTLAERLRLTYQGNVGINTTNQFGTGQGVIGLKDAVVTPGSSPTGGCVVYSTGGNLNVRTSTGFTLNLHSQIHEHRGAGGLADGGALTSPRIVTSIEAVTDPLQLTNINGVAVNVSITDAGLVTLRNSLGFSQAVAKIIGGATSLALRNNGDSADNIGITDAGIVTLRNKLVFGGTNGKIVGGSTDLSLRNNADTADNLLVSNAGVVTIRAGLNLTAGGATISGASTFDAGITNTGGNSNFNSGVLFVDATNSRVGIGTTAPADQLEIKRSTAGAAQMRLNSNGGSSSYSSIGLYEGTTRLGFVLCYGSNYPAQTPGAMAIGADGNNYIDFFNNGGVRMRMNATGLYIGGATSTTHLLELSANDAVKPTSTAWTLPSDSRLKQNIQPFTGGLALLKQINPVSYEYNGLAGLPAGEPGVGVLAEDIATVLPSTVRMAPYRLHPADSATTQIALFDAGLLTWLMLNAIKELDARLLAKLL